jgi:sec-independent protein translocase protein TatB
MFDVGFSELLLIGVVALIVIGPERLPKVARTIGHLVGRAQRYVSDVKTDIQREMDLGDLNDLKNQMQDAAQSVKSSMQDATDSLRKPLDEAQQALNEASASVDALVHTAKAEAGPTTKKDADVAAQGQAPAASPAIDYDFEPLAEPQKVDAQKIEPQKVDSPAAAPAAATPTPGART